MGIIGIRGAAGSKVSLIGSIIFFWALGMIHSVLFYRIHPSFEIIRCTEHNLFFRLLTGKFIQVRPQHPQDVHKRGD